MINADRLHAELAAAGVPITGVNSDGLVSFDPAATDAHKALAASLVAAHDPSPTRSQKLRALGIDQRTAALLLVVKRGALAPQWAQDIVTQALADLGGIT